MPRLFDHLYVAATVLLTVYGQMILKVRIAKYGAFPADTYERLKFLLMLFSDPFILSGFIAAFFASLTWMAAMTKFDISYAYPFMSLNFVLVLLLSGLMLREPVTLAKLCGVLLIVLGTALSARG